MTETQPPMAAEPMFSQNGQAAPASKAKAADPFDPETLRLNAGTDVSVEKVLTAVPVRKPKPPSSFACIRITCRTRSF